MAQAGYTPISLYYSTTPAATPTNTNLVAGELALNIADGKLYYKDGSNVVQLLASKDGASGNVVGPASATADSLVAFDGTTGKLIKQITTGTGVVSALGVNTGTAGAFVVNGGALGTPASGTLTNATGLPIVGGTTGTLSIARGGTGLTTIAARSIFVANVADTLTTVTPGAGQSVRVNSGNTAWEAYTPGTGDVTAAGNNAFTGANTFYNATGQTFGTATAAQDGLLLQGRAGGTGTFRVTLTPGTLSANRTVTFPDASTTVPVASQVLTFTGPTAARTYTLPDSAQTLAGLGVSSQIFTTAQTFRAASAVRSEAASTQDAMVLAGRAGGTGSFAVSLTPTTLSANRTVTFPNNDINFATGLGVANGGTGTTATPTNGQLLIGNGSGFSLATLTAGSNITITNSSGGITIAAAGGGGGVQEFGLATYTSGGLSAYFYNSTSSQASTDLYFYTSNSNPNVGVGDVIQYLNSQFATRGITATTLILRMSIQNSTQVALLFNSSFTGSASGFNFYLYKPNSSTTSLNSNGSNNAQAIFQTSQLVTGSSKYNLITISVMQVGGVDFIITVSDPIAYTS